jgi:hypothetical protein
VVIRRQLRQQGAELLSELGVDRTQLRRQLVAHLRDFVIALALALIELGGPELVEALPEPGGGGLQSLHLEAAVMHHLAGGVEFGSAQSGIQGALARQGSGFVRPPSSGFDLLDESGDFGGAHPIGKGMGDALLQSRQVSGWDRRIGRT